MAQEMNDEGKLVSMMMEANPYVRYAAICDPKGEILWNSYRNNNNNALSCLIKKIVSIKLGR